MEEFDFEAEYEQAQLERLNQLVTALRNARAGTASEDDWTIICYECGVKKEFIWD